MSRGYSPEPEHEDDWKAGFDEHYDIGTKLYTQTKEFADRVSYLRRRRNHWKVEAQQHSFQIGKLSSELRAIRREIEILKQENAALKQENTALKQENGVLKRGDGALRRQIEPLKLQAEQALLYKNERDLYKQSYEALKASADLARPEMQSINSKPICEMEALAAPEVEIESQSEGSTSRTFRPRSNILY
ncbi:hypothetical protein EYR41_006085 [Orbilia oligospora]|uniref:Uncharacterized protein n=1 Tax=Orbilia oligospora TaxID=2813651 RepID=A0A8H2HQ96_ORBOL|nr:hypothetical protein EYR41_006085 [Orbilia oligospora]